MYYITNLKINKGVSVTCDCSWLLDLQLHVNQVLITTTVVSSNPIHGEVYLIQHYVMRQVGGFLWVLWFPRSIKLSVMI